MHFVSCSAEDVTDLDKFLHFWLSNRKSMFVFVITA